MFSQIEHPPRPGFDQLRYWRGQRPSPSSYVYVIQAEGDEPIKVGWTVDVPKRIAELQTGNPRPLRLLHVLVGERRLEHNLHRRLGRPNRLMGEWFDGQEAIGPFLTFIEDLAKRMMESFAVTGQLPRWWEFMPDWELHSGGGTNASGHLVIRRVKPSPVPPDEQLRRQEQAFIGFTRSSS